METLASSVMLVYSTSEYRHTKRVLVWDGVQSPVLVTTVMSIWVDNTESECMSNAHMKKKAMVGPTAGCVRYVINLLVV
jgi:hypothetical protein